LPNLKKQKQKQKPTTNLTINVKIPKETTTKLLLEIVQSSLAGTSYKKCK
jgi:hypothetical protein